MSWRVCPTPGCPEFTQGGKCTDCRGAAELARGRPADRGYDAEYRAVRAKALDGATHCFRCKEPFTVENPATGGHLVPIREGGTTADGVEAECRRCNYGRRG